MAVADDIALQIAQKYMPGLCTSHVFDLQSVAPEEPRKTAEGIIASAAGVRCIAKANAAIFANPRSWERTGMLRRGEVVFTAGPVEIVDFYKMVPIEPSGAVDFSLLDIVGLEIDKPSVVGSWSNWSGIPMSWNEASTCFELQVDLGAATGEFQICCDGDWRRCLHPEVDGGPLTSLVGPDGHGFNKCWMIGDQGATAQEYIIRLAVTSEGLAREVSWGRVQAVQAAQVREPSPVEDAAGDFQVGTLVRIDGLLRTPGLNGEVCLCEAWDRSVQRWRVQLRSGEVKALRPENLEPASVLDYAWWEGRAHDLLRPGLQVRIRGIAGSSELNGRQAEVQRFDPSRNRWLVRVGDERDEKALRADNLQAINDGGAGVPRKQPATYSEPQEEGPLGSFLAASRRDRPGQAGQPQRKLRLGVDLKPKRPGTSRRAPSPPKAATAWAAEEVRRPRHPAEEAPLPWVQAAQVAHEARLKAAREAAEQAAAAAAQRVRVATSPPEPAAVVEALGGGGAALPSNARSPAEKEHTPSSPEEAAARGRAAASPPPPAATAAAGRPARREAAPWSPEEVEAVRPPPRPVAAAAAATASVAAAGGRPSPAATTQSLEQLLASLADEEEAPSPPAVATTEAAQRAEAHRADIMAKVLGKRR